MIGWAFETLIASALLMALVLLVRERVAATFGPRIAYLLWLLPFVRMLLPRLPAAARPPVALPLDLDLSAVDLPAPSVSGAAPTIAPPPPGALDWLAGHWPLLLVAFWLGGAIVHFCWQIGLYRRFLHLALKGSALLCRTCGIAIHQGPGVGGPAAVGIVRRRILLPADFTRRYDAIERRLVLAHEVAHHRRGDLIANGCALVLLSLHWFNPLAYRAYRAFRADQELACDATVLAHEAPDLMPAYGAALVKSVHAATPAAACAIGTATMLKRRLKMMAIPDRSRTRRIGGGLLATAAILGGLGLTASGSVASPSRLPGFGFAVNGIEGSGTSFSYRNSGLLRGAAYADDDAVAAVRAPRAPPIVRPHPIRTADATPVLRAGTVSDGYIDPPIPPAPPAPAAAPVAPLPLGSVETAEMARAIRETAAAARTEAARARTEAARERTEAAQARTEAAKARDEARIAADQARREAHAEADRDRAQARADAARERSDALAEAARERAEASRERVEADRERAQARTDAAQARADAARERVQARNLDAAWSTAHVQQTIGAATAQARAELTASCPRARPAAGSESDGQAIGRLVAGCVDRKAIHAEIVAAFRAARAGLRNAAMSDDARDRAMAEMDRALAQIEARGLD